MIYKGSSVSDQELARVKSKATDHSNKELLGFNEPDHEKQGNTTVENAREL